MTAPLVAEPGGNLLLSFAPGPGTDLDHLDPAVPLPLALVAVVADGRVLLGRNRWREEWELPGGMLDDGETARAAALRELAEETGVVAAGLDLVGVATFRLEPDQRLEHAALFRTVLAPGSDPVPTFGGNDEISALCWWDPSAPLADLSPIDAWLARAAV